MSAITVCTCGHPPTSQKPGSCGTGYGSILHGDVYETRCYECCAKYERERMTATGRAVLYLVEPHGSRINARVTDWTGLVEFIAWGLKQSKHGGGFGSQRTDAWFNGPDGYVWHAINRGDMTLARCRRTKEKAK